MFEEYLTDARHFCDEASNARNDQIARRHYRVAVFCTMSAVEAYVNYIADAQRLGGMLALHEIAFISDKKFGIAGGELAEQVEYHRLDDKLKFLLTKFVPDYEVISEPSWCRLMALKNLRDDITHPRQDEDEVSIQEYQTKIEQGLSSAIDIMDKLFQGVFDRGLRAKILELRYE